MMPNKPSLSVDLVFESPLWAKARISAKSRVPEILDLAWSQVPQRPKKVIPEITVTLTDDARIRVFNREYRGKDKATNVLSFPMFEQMSEIPSGAGDVPIGDIIIAFETMKRESLEQNKTLADHFAHMLVHGFLHLLGYDHLTDAEAHDMESLEIKILGKLKIANPY